MALQTSANVKVVIARETTDGTAATAAVTSRVLRITDSPGLELRRAQILSNEKRDDGNRGMARLGGKSVDGSHNSELTVGGAMSMLTESILRAAYSTSTAVALSGVVFGTNQITQAAGDWVGTSGLRVGDIFTISGTATSGNHSLRTPITAISSLTITVPAGTFVTATSTGTLTRLRKLSQGTTPVRHSYTIEQYDEDIDLSELFLGNRLVGARFSFRPGQMATVQWSFMGMDRTVLATGTSPYFSGPTTTTGLALVADDSAILKDGVAVTQFTGLDLDFALAAQAVNVIGSTTAAGVFDNDLTVGGTITGLRSDFAYLSAFDAETEFDIQIVLTEPTSAPKPCFAIHLPRVKLGAVTAPVGGSDGAKVESRTLLIGPKETATGYDTGVAKFSQSTE